MDNPNITMEEYIRLEEEKARKHGKVFNWETAKYGKIWYDEDVHDLRSVETEFPAIVFNDNLTSNETLFCEPTVSSLNNNEIEFRISFYKFDDEDYTVIFDKNSFSYKIIYANDLKTDSENDNEKVNMPLFPSPEPSVSCIDGLDFFKDFQNEFLAIVYNDALTSKLDFSTEPTVSPQHIDEFNLKDETSLSKCDEEEHNVIYFNDLFPLNVIYPDELKSDTDNDNDKIDIEQSSGNLSVKELPDVISTDVGAYEKGSNKLLETSHDTSNKFFKTETFVKELNVNIITWDYLNKGMPFIFLIKNFYMPFGIPFDLKLFYKDVIKLRQTVYTAYPNPMDTAYCPSGRYPIFISSIVYTTYSLNEYNVLNDCPTGIDTAYLREWIRRIDFLYIFRTLPSERKRRHSEVQAQIRRIFLDGYGVLDVRISFLHISSFKLQNACLLVNFHQAPRISRLSNLSQGMTADALPSAASQDISMDHWLGIVEKIQYFQHLLVSNNVMNEKPKKTLDEITHDMFLVLSLQQLYKISTMYWDDKYVKCRHRYAVSSLMDTAYRMLEQ
ncbi:hypothetical protein Tco_0823840 [Tanacetum coccineum]|uniref:Uncharacterized protein n=1 Tax=Tanacetum coccineum TaxID=301880 RepID=A0ABQ5AN37_9ASTR